MTGKPGKNKKPAQPRKLGRYCWACQRQRSNESFSGPGHARHLCRECQKLGAAELDFRSARANLERMMTPDGLVRRKQRRHFRKFLEDPRPRVQQLAEHLWRLDRQIRAERRELPEASPADEDDVPMEFMAEDG